MRNSGQNSFNERCAEYVRKFASEDAVASIVRDQYREYGAEEEENDTGKHTIIPSRSIFIYLLF
jgi:hypothetical protein